MLLAAVCVLGGAAGRGMAAQPAGGAAVQPAPAAADRTEQWRQDIAKVRAELPKSHVNLFHRVKREEFESALDGLSEAVPTLTDQQITVRLMQVVARMGDSHTGVSFASAPRIAFARVALGVHVFDDGVYVLVCHRDDSRILGCRITHVGDFAVEEVLELIGTTFAYDNRSSLLARAPTLFPVTDVLAALGVLVTADSMPLTLEGADGVSFSHTLKPLTAAPGPGEMMMAPMGASPAKPLYMTNLVHAYWWTMVPETKTAYVCYNRCSPRPDLAFDVFQKDLLEGLTKNGAERLVIDLRSNSGGNSAIFTPLIDALAKHPTLNQKDRLYVIIARRTFSSGQMNADELRAKTNATLVGEPTGGRPNHFGEVRNFTLPHSWLSVSYSTKYFTRSAVDSATTEPDVAVPYRYEDYAAGRDPYLGAILERKIGE